MILCTYNQYFTIHTEFTNNLPLALPICLCQKLHRMVCHLRQMVLHNAIGYVHAAARAAGADIIRMGSLDILALAIINLP